MKAWLTGILCLFIVSASWAQERKTSVITITGKLIQIMAIGGETTGWAVELESDLRIDTQKIKRIEVDPAGKKLGGYKDKRVEVKGRLTLGGGGPERGYYPVIEIEGIRELKRS